ncbi:MAG: helix-turn-helix transcriptional regulator [Campylobacterota bacterium]|nr:helix-turn-helix transcriptional regulator [Campylobacterota bacterium]
MREDIKSIVATAILKRRHEIGMEQEELGDYANVSVATISKLEHAKANVTIDTLGRIIEILGLEIKIAVKQSI